MNNLRRSTGTALFCSMFLPRLGLAQAQKNSDDFVPALRRLRAEAEEGAAVVKSRFSTSANAFIVTRRKYASARAAIEEVAGFLKQAILNGDESEIRKSDSLARAAADARLAATDLLDHVEKVLGVPQKRSIAAAVAALTAIIAVALDVLKGADAASDLGDKIGERRLKRATQIESEIVWRTWDELGAKK